MGRYRYPSSRSAAGRAANRVFRHAASIGVALLLLALLAVLDRAGLFGRAARPDMEAYHEQAFRVVRVIDGDTLDVAAPDRRSNQPATRVRLWGVDTPETVKPDTPVQHYGPEATAYLKSMVESRTVTLKLHPVRTRDKYDRLLAYVLLGDGTNVNERIIATGHGYADPISRHPLQHPFKKAQTAARACRAGLWAEVADADLPWYYQGKLKLPAATPATSAPSED